MQRNLVLRMSMLVTLVCGLVVAASLARADDRDKDTTCSDRTIEGDYASAVDGVILPAPGVSLPIRGINMVHNDGKGHSTQVDSLILNGAPISDWTPVTGTYHQRGLYRNGQAFPEHWWVCKPSLRGGEAWQGNPRSGVASL